MKTSKIFISGLFLFAGSLLVSGCASDGSAPVLRSAARGAGHGAINENIDSQVGRGAAHGALHGADELRRDKRKNQ